MYAQSQAKVTDGSLDAHKNAKDQEHLLDSWTGVEIRQYVRYSESGLLVLRMAPFACRTACMRRGITVSGLTLLHTF